MSHRLRVKSLRARIIFWSLIPAAVLVGAMGFTVWGYYNIVINQFVATSRELIRLAASQLAVDLDGYAGTLDGLSHRLQLYAEQPPAQLAALEQARSQLLIFDAGVLVLDRLGRVVAAAPERSDLLNQDWSTRSVYGDVVRTGSPAYSDILTDGPGGVEVVAVVVPIIGPDGELSGSLVGMLNLDAASSSALFGKLVALRVRDSGRTYLVDSQGRVIYRSDAGPAGQDLRSLSAVQRAAAGEVGLTRTTDPDGQPVFASYAPVPGTRWGLVHEESTAVLWDPRVGYTPFLLSLLALGIVIPVLFVIVGTRRITRPITALTAATRAVAAGDLNQRIDIDTGDELQELAEQFNCMAERLSESYATLHGREERLQLVLQATQDGIWDWDLSSNNVYFSPRWKAMLGYGEDEISNRFESWRALVHPEDLPRTEAALQACLTGASPSYRLEHRLRHKDGFYRCILARGIALRDSEGRPYRMLGSHTDITKRKQAETALQERLDFEALIASISTEFVTLGPEQFDAAIRHALQTTGEFAKVDRSYLFLFSGDGALMTNTHEWCKSGITPYLHRLQHVPVASFPWLMAQLNCLQPVVVGRVADLPADAGQERAEFEAQAIQSLLVVPMAYGGSPAGFLGFDAVRAERVWTDDHVALLRIVGEMLINALEHKRGLAIQAGQRRFLELLATGGDFVETLHTLVRLVEEQWPGMLGLILLLDPDGRHLHIGAAVALPEEYVRSIEGLEIGPMVGSCGTACYRRERVIVEDIAIDPRWEGLRALGLKYGLRACWSEPVFSADGQVVATFAMYYRQPRSPTQAELRAIETAAHLVGVAIQNRQGQEALHRAYQTMEKRVEERTRELAVLNAIAAVVSQSLDLKEILGAALDKVLEITGLEFGGAWRTDIDAKGGMERQALVCRGLSPAFIEYAARSSSSPPVVTLTAPTGQPAVWEVAEAPESYELKQALEREGVRQVVSIPLMAKGRLVGSMPLGTAQIRTFEPELLSLLAAIGQQVGMAVDNARLFESERVQHQESERRRLVAESLREYLKVLNSDLPLEDVLEHIVAHAGRLLGSQAVALFQLQPVRQVLTIQAAHGLEKEYVAGMVVPVGQGAVGRAVVTRQPVIVRSEAATPRVFAPDVDLDWRPFLVRMVERYSVLVGVPLILKTDVFGALALYYSRDRVFSPDELLLVSMFADQAALAIDNGRLREHVESSAIAAERTRLSRELHDSVTQSLYSVTMFAEAAGRMLTTGRAAGAVESLHALRDTAQEALRGMRLLIFQLRPPAIEKYGLAGALQARLDAVENRAGLQADLQLEGGEQLVRLPLGCQEELYHIAQEALNNSLKHAHAHQVHVVLVSDEVQTRLTVSDDGLGFEGSLAGASGGVGLTSMRERAQHLRAELQVVSAPGKGTQITVLVPARGHNGNGAGSGGAPAREREG